MKIRKISALILSLAIIVGITACDKKESTSNTGLYIEPAVLTQQEENILNLVNSANRPNLIADFNLDDSVKSVEITVYRLVDGQWKPESKSRQELEGSRGRFSFSFKRLSEGFRTAFQSKNNNGSTEHSIPYENMTEEQKALAKMSVGSTMLSNQTKVEYEKEIPIVLQVITEKNEVRLTLDGFENPEEYEKMDYNAVYAVTIMFSQKEINDMA